MKGTWEFLKIHTYKGNQSEEEKEAGKLQKFTQIYITFTLNFSQHAQISCLKNQHAKNQIVCLNTSFTIPLWKDKVKVSHEKISHIFLHNKNASTETHNYPINLFFSINKDLIYFWCVNFFLGVSHNISWNMRFWKDVKKCKNVILFLMGSYIHTYKYT